MCNMPISPMGYDITYFVEDDIMYAPHHTYNSPLPQLYFVDDIINRCIYSVSIYASPWPMAVAPPAFGMMMGVVVFDFRCYFHLCVETAAVVPL